MSQIYSNSAAAAIHRARQKFSSNSPSCCSVSRPCHQLCTDIINNAEGNAAPVAVDCALTQPRLPRGCCCRRYCKPADYADNLKSHEQRKFLGKCDHANIKFDGDVGDNDRVFPRKPHALKQQTCEISLMKMQRFSPPQVLDLKQNSLQRHSFGDIDYRNCQSRKCLVYRNEKGQLKNLDLLSRSRPLEQTGFITSCTLQHGDESMRDRSLIQHTDSLDILVEKLKNRKFPQETGRNFTSTEDFQCEKNLLKSSSKKHYSEGEFGDRKKGQRANCTLCHCLMRRLT